MEVKNHWLQCFYPAFLEKLRKKSGRQTSLKSMAHHAAGIGTCTRSGMINPSHLSSEMQLGIFPDHTEFQSWILNFRTERFARRQRIPHARLQWTKEIEAAKSLYNLITPITGKQH